jgi:polar amino acid transport system ATP-binding protein
MINSQPLLIASELKKRFGNELVLCGVSMSVAAGQVIGIIGASGSGKSTFLRCLNFLESPDGGSIVFDGETLCYENEKGLHKVPEWQLRRCRAQMPMVFQQFNLFQHRTALGNIIEGPLIVGRRPRSEVIEEAKEVLNLVGLRDKANAYPGELSGGQQQRVAIARALMMHPKVILFDEPTSALDPELVNEVLETIRRLARSGMTMIIVTHEMNFARSLAVEIHFMADGRIQESGSPDAIFGNPANVRLKSFVASVVR